MIQPFNILDRNQKVHSNYLLEASAGTGKTYSIENIVVRLLIDKTFPCSLSNLLVVTFTKASTADLKVRIRGNLDKTLGILKGKDVGDSPDYLKALLERPEDLVFAQRQLEHSLVCFEQAPIFTIHGFCHRMLREYLFEADVGATLGESEEGISPSLLFTLIKDFFRTEVSEKLVSLGQLQLLLKYVGSFEQLEKELFNLMTRGMAIAPVTSLEEHYKMFCEGMHQFKQRMQASPDKILEDFERQAPLYNKICNQQKKPKEENLEKVKRFVNLLKKEHWELVDLDLLISDGVYLAEALDPTNLSKKKSPMPPCQLHCPDLVASLNQKLVPIVTAAQNPHYILSTLAYRCKEMVQSYLDQKEIFSFDDLLMGMYKAIQKEEFTSKIQQRFNVAIIDEFQDTDPLQWEIFKKIFLPKESPSPSRWLYLVGDPKQSIYGFRQADIYTYLAAGEVLGKTCKAFLDTNYRSTCPLVEALNALFCHETAPGLMALPKRGQTLPYQHVKWGGKILPKKLEDQRGAIHFFSFEESAESLSKKTIDAEESYFIPFIAQELLQLQKQGISLKDCAVLVADRFQAERLMQHFKTLSIPTVAQHSENLSATVAFSALQELLEAMLTPQQESSLKIALAGPLLGWTQPEIALLKDPLLLEPLIAKGMALRKIWFQEGFSAFFQAVMSSVAESILMREGGLLFYHHIHQIAELLIDREGHQKLSPHALLEVLEEIRLLENSGDQQIKQRLNPERGGVRITTIHSSKGLEFDFVFALGVIRRSKVPSHFIPIAHADALPVLTAVSDANDPRYIQHALELDAEKVRQLYVAFTRAKQRLYVPLLFRTSDKECKLGTASPMELYLSLMRHSRYGFSKIFEESTEGMAPMGQPEVSFQELYTRISQLKAENSLSCIRTLGCNHNITLSTSDENPQATPATDSPCDRADLLDIGMPGSNGPTQVELHAPLVAKIRKVPCYMHSFTALSTVTKAELLTLDEDAEIEGNYQPPNDFTIADKSPHTLPAGASTGTLLHTLMEMVPFEMAAKGRQSPELLHFIEKFLKDTPFASWIHVIADMIYDALMAPLPIDGLNVCLKDINPKHCYREHPFIYPAPQDLHPDLIDKPGYLQGVIDLIFEYREKYCILDWKSNWLGPNSSFYSQSHMESAMRAHDYFLQAQIYKEALKRYLRLLDERPFEKLFGGVLYVFMRGLENRHSYFYLPESST